VATHDVWLWTQTEGYGHTEARAYLGLAAAATGPTGEWGRLLSCTFHHREEEAAVVAGRPATVLTHAWIDSYTWWLSKVGLAALWLLRKQVRVTELAPLGTL
jgi:hypothetical protein